MGDLMNQINMKTGTSTPQIDPETARACLTKWQSILRLMDWDIQLSLVTTDWKKTGDIKIDADDRKAILLLNARNPRHENVEEVIIHELLHLRLWGMDQMLEQLLYGVFGKDESDAKQQFVYGQFMTLLESTVENLTKAFLSLGGENKALSFGRIRQMVETELNPGQKDQQ